eukprot:TRINITY_DN22525_c0_g1_i2.p1 TRINITY_DN22525_c0_g1~~TRINITY_DN22525_c0_g1_i2.p1  ORF type:complete len:320 (+),score=82.80 TRINITY_DN22525_c0_g1_i2:28-960(+)
MKLPGILSRSSAAGDEADARPSLPSLLPKQGLRLPSFGKGAGTEAEDGLKDSVCKDDFQVIRLLGEGGFSKVKLVRHRRSRRLFAMKQVEKAHLLDRRYAGDKRIEERALAERDIGASAYESKSPFIVRLFASFQTPDMLFYILEYCEGGELFAKMQAQPGFCFTEPTACFYAAEVCSALVHLHGLDTIHRDVRLENILLCSDGHIKLADFGIAKTKVSEQQRPSHVFSFADSQAEVFYPPEFHRGEDYGKDLDCWQLGVATFAMLTGRLPEDVGGTGDEKLFEPPELQSGITGEQEVAVLRYTLQSDQL